MIRSNVGNVITNGMQVMNIAATTAAKYIKANNEDAASRLNAKAQANSEENTKRSDKPDFEEYDFEYSIFDEDYDDNSDQVLPIKQRMQFDMSWANRRAARTIQPTQITPYKGVSNNADV